MSFDVERIRKDFPVLDRLVYDNPLVYLDNAATSLKPQIMIDSLLRYYQKDTANVHRGLHYLSQEATINYEKTRSKVQKFIDASSREEIIFTKGATEAVNLVAHSLRKRLSSKDSILISTMEHHSNIVPWQFLAEATGAEIKEIPVNDKGEIELGVYKKLLDDSVKIVAVTHISNTLGTVNPVEEMITLARGTKALVLVDAAQSIIHQELSVKEMDCDFLVFSAHKALGPTGLGVLYGKNDHMKSFPPYESGGGMIEDVTLMKSSFACPPGRFEAGTPPVAQVIAFGASLDYLEQMREEIPSHEKKLLEYATWKLKKIPGLTITGEADEKIPVISFNLEGIHADDVGTILNRRGIAVRTGHHCNRPLLARYNLSSLVRASFCLYNTEKEVDTLTEGIQKVREFFVKS